MRIHRTLVLGAVTLALIASACSPGEGDSPDAGETQAADLPAVTIASAPFWESAVVAEIYAQALEREGFTVDRGSLELGPRDVTHTAITSGEINLVPEYIGGYLAQTFDGTPTADTEETYTALQEALTEVDLVAFEPTPGTDADAFVVRQETADDLGLTTMSDLAEVAGELTWGVAVECSDNPNCGPGLERVYGINLDEIAEVETLAACSPAIADALNAEEIDVAQVCTTSPEIERFNLVLLEDDGGLQPAQNIVPVVTRELADAGGETLESTLNAISELLTTEELTSLGVLVVLDGESYADAARQWLEDHGQS